MNINISEIVENKIKQMQEDKVIEKKIEEELEKVVISSVSSACSSYDLKKSIQEAASREVSEVVNKISFDTYTAFIGETMKKAIQGIQEDVLKKNAERLFDNLFFKDKDKFKLSEIIKLYKKVMDDLEDEEKEEADNGNFYCDIERKIEGSGDWFKYVYIKLALHNKSRRYIYEEDYKVDITLMNYKNEGYKVIRVKYKDNDLTKLEDVRYYSEFESKLAGLYFNQTVIDIDIEDEYDVDTSIDGVD